MKHKTRLLLTKLKCIITDIQRYSKLTILTLSECLYRLKQHDPSAIKNRRVIRTIRYDLVCDQNLLGDDFAFIPENQVVNSGGQPFFRHKYNVPFGVDIDLFLNHNLTQIVYDTD